MKHNSFKKGFVWFFFLVSCFPLLGQDRDSLTLPHEVGLNERQPPDLVLKTIGIKPGMIIGEVGAGRGRYTVQIASRIRPSGMIYANDIEKEYLQYLERRCADHGLTNVKTVLGGLTDPKLPPAALDMVIMVNVVHCLAEPVALLRNIKKSLKPDGVIAIVEGNLDKAPDAAGEWYSRSKLLKIYKDAGYDLVREETFLPKDNIYILK
ncbi:MAG: class I SAM-dependent methyltransferase [Candidatus Aminicenantes bacterium]|nr:class I SAM-dependent methyltransferase [Candidatus Aminicenantes bacterium]MDH5384367.1 class I SAM-dependent methyltransferase [Candidatus Aminicenantes bacterium]MDH5743851.1 class I SAM-dependent methyltransferase [Candidatus Aminicenantes bacterium]